MAAGKKDDLLARLQLAAKLGQVTTTKHARDRMGERGATAADVARAIATATSATEQAEGQTVRLEGGTDTDGDSLTVVVAEHPRGLRIVTVM
jgi:hypothetical protein